MAAMLQTVVTSISAFLTLGLLFAIIGRYGTGRYAPPKERLSWAELPTNVIYFFTDHWFIAPALALMAALLATTLIDLDLLWAASGPIADLPFWAQLLIGLYVADLVGYWRHRLLHHSALWPVHAVHHSDRDISWISLLRQHPIERLISVVAQVGVLVLLGLPASVILANAFIRMLYGHFQHMDLGWTYGPFRHVFVSPAMHRWHHAADAAARDKNFAVIFAFNDVIFGTYYLPGPCRAELGTGDAAYPKDWLGQLVAPFSAYLRLLSRRVAA